MILYVVTCPPADRLYLFIAARPSRKDSHIGRFLRRVSWMCVILILAMENPLPLLAFVVFRLFHEIWKSDY
jgi:hypothetical protein